MLQNRVDGGGQARDGGAAFRLLENGPHELGRLFVGEVDEVTGKIVGRLTVHGLSNEPRRRVVVLNGAPRGGNDDPLAEVNV